MGFVLKITLIYCIWLKTGEGVIRNKLLLFQGEQKCQFAVGKIVKDRNNEYDHDHD